MAAVRVQVKRRDADRYIAATRSHAIRVGAAAHTSEIERRRRELEALYQADERLYAHQHPRHVLQALVDIAVDILAADKSAVLCLDQSGMHLQAQATRGFSQATASALTFARTEGVVGRVVVTGEPYISLDAANDPNRAAERPEIVDLVLAEGVRSFALLPIKLNGQVFGVFNLSFARTQAIGEEEIRLFMALAQRGAQAIANAQSFDAEQRRSEQFRVIGELASQITAIMPVDEILHRTVRLIHDTFNYYHVGIGLVEEGAVVYRIGAGDLWDRPDFKYKPARLKVGGEGLSGWVAATGQPLMAPDVRHEPRFVHLEGSQTLSEIVVPILVKSKVIGVLDAQSRDLNAFDDTDLHVLQAAAHQVGAAIENTQLYNQAQQSAVVEERSRLARDLHDAVTQTLFSASLLAEAIPAAWEMDQAEGKQLLQELRQLSRGALAEMRTLLLELRPGVLVEVGLGDLLRQLADAMTGRTGIPVTITVRGHCKLPGDVHVAVYRIAQEALNNVVKHAQASRVEIALRCTGGNGAGRPRAADNGYIASPAHAGADAQIELTICDDGIGFDPADVTPEHLGLSIIRERAQAIGAELSIESAPGCGVRLTVRWATQSDAGYCAARPAERQTEGVSS